VLLIGIGCLSATALPDYSYNHSQSVAILQRVPLTPSPKEAFVEISTTLAGVAGF
jgi:hypothetical protein